MPRCTNQRHTRDMTARAQCQHFYYIVYNRSVTKVRVATCQNPFYRIQAKAKSKRAVPQHWQLCQTTFPTLKQPQAGLLPVLLQTCPGAQNGSHPAATCGHCSKTNPENLSLPCAPTGRSLHVRSPSDDASSLHPLPYLYESLPVPSVASVH